MFKINKIKTILYFIFATIYALSFILMHFIEILHDFHFQFNLIGSILLVLFIITRGRHNFNQIQVIASVLFILALAAQSIIETLRVVELIQSNSLIHLIFHVVIGIAYFIFAIVMYFELTKSYKNTLLRKASFDYNDAILFEYDSVKNNILLELSDKLNQTYGLSNSSYKTDYLTFLTWVHAKDQQKIQLSSNLKDNLNITNKVFHININHENHPIVIKVKGAYIVGHKTIFLGFDYTNTENIENLVVYEQDSKLLLLENLQVGVIEIELVYDEQNELSNYKYVYLNKAIQQMMNYSEAQVVNQFASTLIPNQFKERLEIYKRIIKSNKPITFETQLEINARWYSVTSYLSGLNKMILIYQDIHELKMLNSQLEHMVTHSKVSRFLNNQGLDNVIKVTKYTNNAVCVYISIQGFEQIRAFYGEGFSNELLKVISNVLTRYDNHKNIIANILYKHFVLILIDPTDKELEETIAHAASLIYRKYRIFDREIAVRLNISYAQTGTYCNDLSELIAYASIANEKAKKSTQNKIVVFETRYKDTMNKENILASKLYDAIESGLIDVYFQKIYNTNKKEYEYYEALARWKDSEFGVISPDDFFNIASKSYLSDFLDEYLIKETFSKFKLIMEKAQSNLKLNINISPNFFFRADFLDIIVNESEINNLKPSQIVIELSENIFIESVNVCKDIIDLIRSKGFLVAIDDFGSQYSSIGLLERVKFDMLKLDGIFAENIQSESIQELVKTIIDINQKQDIAVVIEKIENQALANKFVRLGCYLHQGYHYHKPEKII